MEICPAVLVCQEGGYNIEYLGQHAAGVCQALIGTPSQSMDLQQSDWDAEITSMDQVEVESEQGKSKLLDWALEDIELTRK